MPRAVCIILLSVYRTKAFCIPALEEDISQEARLVRIFLG